MIFKNRSWWIGNPKSAGIPIRVSVMPDRKSGELSICEEFSFLGFHKYTEEELLDMLAILRKVKKESREDSI